MRLQGFGGNINQSNARRDLHRAHLRRRFEARHPIVPASGLGADTPSGFCKAAREFREERERNERSQQQRRPTLELGSLLGDDSDDFGLPKVYGDEPGDQDASNGQPYKPPGEPERRPRSAKFALVDWNDIGFAPNEQWMIEDVLPLRGLRAVLGKQGSFKSFVVLSLALAVMSGEAWAGKRVEQGNVLYLAAEDGAGMRKRIAPHKAKRKVARGRFALVETTPRLGQGEGDLPALVTAVEQARFKPALIVIDTAAAAIGPADENNAGMASLIANAQKLAQRFDCLVLILHHVGHDDGAQKRPRGWSGLGPALDVQILCERPDRDMRAVLTVQKQKEDADSICLEARLERVEVVVCPDWRDRHGGQVH